MTIWSIVANEAGNIYPKGMIEHFLNRHQLLQYRIWKSQFFSTTGFVIVFTVIGGLFIMAGNHLIKSQSELSFIGYEAATVTSSFMKQHKFDQKLYLRVKIKTGQTLTITTKSGSLFALSGQIVCLKLFQNNQEEVVKASLADFEYCG